MLVQKAIVLSSWSFTILCDIFRVIPRKRPQSFFPRVAVWIIYVCASCRHFVMKTTHYTSSMRKVIFLFTTLIFAREKSSLYDLRKWTIMLEEWLQKYFATCWTSETLEQVMVGANSLVIFRAVTKFYFWYIQIERFSFENTASWVTVWVHDKGKN